VQGADGQLYGSTVVGGALGLGVLFRVDLTAPAALPTLTGLTLTASTVVGGRSTTGRVTLGGAAPAGGVVVALSSSSTVASVPATVKVPAGATSATFVVSTRVVKQTRTPTITARYNNSSVSAVLTVRR
jgi:uncharacterized repeat protein (TIGR03803 family)